MMNLIISVKPKYVNEILAGRKKYEYRKSIFKKPVNKIYIYSCCPQKKIVGYFFYNCFIQGTPEYIWKQTSTVSGISESEFFNYFKNKNDAIALKINHFYPFTVFPDISVISANFCAPQSYRYLEKDIADA
jgi:predicted transcriptional regulator